jgi:hypothetical protein
MKHKSLMKDREVVSVLDDKSSQSPLEKSGILKRFLDWIAKGAKKVKTCPT